jgi:hypothetical protein
MTDPELRAKILARRARRADDARTVARKATPLPKCAWCNEPRSAGSTFCRSCEPHKEGILRVISLPKVEPVDLEAIFARSRRQWRSTRR